MAAGFQGTPRKKIALDNNKLSLSTPSPVDPKAKSKLVWGFHNNNPRLTVYTGDPSENTEKTGYGKIVANLDTPTLFAFFQLMEMALKAENGFKAKIENKNFTFFGGKRSDFPVVLTELWCGKDKEGAIWMSITAKDRPMIKFIISPTDFHNLFNGDGSPMTKGEVSAIYATGYLVLLKQMYAHISVSEFVEITMNKPGQQGGFQQGGYQRGGQQGGYQQKSPPAADPAGDDMPF